MLAHTHKLLPPWPWAFQEESRGLLPSAKEPDCRGPPLDPCGPHQCLCPAVPSLQPLGLGFGGAWMPLPDAAAPHRRHPVLMHKPLPWPSPGCHRVVYFYIFRLNELCTLQGWPHISPSISRGDTGMSHMSPPDPPLREKPEPLEAFTQHWQMASEGHQGHLACACHL